MILQVETVVDLILSSTFINACKCLTRSRLTSAERPNQWVVLRLTTRHSMSIQICAWWVTPPCCPSVPRLEDPLRRVSLSLIATLQLQHIADHSCLS